MKRKPIKIDWQELEAAFDNKREDLIYYLDLVTGHVVLEGEGEEGEFEDDDDLLDNGGEDEPVKREETTRLYIEPPGPEDEIAWMEDFVDESTEMKPEIQDKLQEALGQPDSAEAFREELRHFPEERERWFLYRIERLHGAMDSWLDTNEVHPAEPSPWKI